MTTTVEAIYENGKLVLPRPLSIPEKCHVRVTIETTDPEREARLKLSEESLTRVWDNDADDVFNAVKRPTAQRGKNSTPRRRENGSVSLRLRPLATAPVKHLPLENESLKS